MSSVHFSVGDHIHEITLPRIVNVTNIHMTSRVVTIDLLERCRDR